MPKPRNAISGPAGKGNPVNIVVDQECPRGWERLEGVPCSRHPVHRAGAWFVRCSGACR